MVAFFLLDSSICFPLFFSSLLLLFASSPKLPHLRPTSPSVARPNADGAPLHLTSPKINSTTNSKSYQNNPSIHHNISKPTAELTSSPAIELFHCCPSFFLTNPFFLIDLLSSLLSKLPAPLFSFHRTTACSHTPLSTTRTFFSSITTTQFSSARLHPLQSSSAGLLLHRRSSLHTAGILSDPAGLRSSSPPVAPSFTLLRRRHTDPALPLLRPTGVLLRLTNVVLSSPTASRRPFSFPLCAAEWPGSTPTDPALRRATSSSDLHLQHVRATDLTSSSAEHLLCRVQLRPAATILLSTVGTPPWHQHLHRWQGPRSLPQQSSSSPCSSSLPQQHSNHPRTSSTAA